MTAGVVAKTVYFKLRTSLSNFFINKIKSIQAIQTSKSDTYKTVNLFKDRKVQRKVSEQNLDSHK